jgi:hypothetical protein
MKKKQRAAMIIRVKPIIFARKLAGINLANLPKPTSSKRELIYNSGGPSGENHLQQAVKTAVINKRAGGMGLISGRKAFQKTMKEGVAILHAIQDVYLEKDITVA